MNAYPNISQRGTTSINISLRLIQRVIILNPICVCITSKRNCLFHSQCSNLCQHTTQMHVFDKDGRYCLICRSYEYLCFIIMAKFQWYIEGAEFSNCNCDYACPCQFESRRSTHGICRGFGGAARERGEL